MAFSLENILAAAIFIGLRVSGLVLFVPGLGNSAVPPQAKAAFVCLCVAVLWPVVHVPPLSTSPLLLAGVVLNELAIGVIVGLCLSFIFDAVQFAGQILGMQMGFSLATMIDPQSQADSMVLSVFYQTIVLLIFFSLDVHHWVLRALVSSFRYLPAGEPIVTAPRVAFLMHTAASIWVIGLQIAAPVLIATVIADFVLAFLGKASPQFPVLLVGLSVKSVLGMLVSIAAMTVWPRYLELHFENAIRWTEQILRLTH
ncbi:MAG: flagellar biosynthetic protein FliR [Acidobacteriota bacterium]|nr:flagellar biosynthetic protein FliR [Acidobacteriota bacterium]